MEYRLPKIEDKEMVKNYIEEHYLKNEQNISASNMLTSMDWEEWVKKVNNDAVIGDTEWGKSLTYLVIDEDKLIGFLSIRYDLPKQLVDIYGHIGYGVRPSERKKGYASKMLKQALKECKKNGMESVILGCYCDNIGSKKIILNNGGIIIVGMVIVIVGLIGYTLSRNK